MKATRAATKASVSPIAMKPDAAALPVAEGLPLQAAAAAPDGAAPPVATPVIDADARTALIAAAAYALAEQRGFGPGDAIADWLEAERVIDAHIALGGS